MRHAKVPRSSWLVPYIRTSLRTRRYKATNTDARIIDSLFLLAKALLRYVSQLFEVSGSTLAYPRFRPPRVGTDVYRAVI